MCAVFDQIGAKITYSQLSAQNEYSSKQFWYCGRMFQHSCLQMLLSTLHKYFVLYVSTFASFANISAQFKTNTTIYQNPDYSSSLPAEQKQ